MQKRNYGLVYFDNNTRQTIYMPFMTKKEIEQYIRGLNLGKDFVNTISIVKMVEHWNAYDGLVYPRGEENET